MPETRFEEIDTAEHDYWNNLCPECDESPCRTPHECSEAHDRAVAAYFARAERDARKVKP